MILSVSKPKDSSFFFILHIPKEKQKVKKKKVSFCFYLQLSFFVHGLPITTSVEVL